ncbi:MAG: hypothetical protein ACTTH8_08235 [Treponema sp.]
MFDLEGKEAAVTLAVYQKEMGKPYTQMLKDFITANAEKLSEDDALLLLIFACSTAGCVQEAKRQAADIINRTKQ